MRAPLRLLLGPQRPVINLDRAIERTGIGNGPIGVISAAWQEAEGDIGDIQRLIENPLFELGLYQRAEAVFTADEPLREAYRKRQEQLKELQRLHQLRLKQLTVAARGILRATGDIDAIADERRHAISQLRALDQHHLRQIRKINTRCDEELAGRKSPELSRHLEAVQEELARCETVLITGGNVVVLINRLRLFGMDVSLQSKNLIAWSAGAMALCDRIVLFHDRMPQGRRDPEVICEGLGIVPDTILLPDARNRLRTNESIRTSLFSRRFSPATCLTLDNGSLLLFEDGKVRRSENIFHLSREGQFTRVRAA